MIKNGECTLLQYIKHGKSLSAAFFVQDEFEISIRPPKRNIYIADKVKLSVKLLQFFFTALNRYFVIIIN